MPSTSSLPEAFRETAAIFLEECRGSYGEDLVSLAVFGSAARGTATPESDLDVLIVARNLVPGRLNRMERFYPIEESVLKRARPSPPIEISPVIKTPEEVRAGSPLFWDMTEDVVLLFDRGDFLKRFLDGVAARMKELGARKVRHGSAWYWILKDELRPGEVFEI